MARGRMLNKSVSASFKFNQLPDDTCRLLATWIIPHLDKNGVFYGDAGLVRSQVFPLRDDLSNAQVEAYLRAIEGVADDEGGHIMVRFKAKGRTWQYWPGFDDNQIGLRKDREGTAYPTPPGYVPNDAEDVPEPGQVDDGDLLDELPQPSGNTPAKAKQSKALIESKQSSNAKGNGEGNASKSQNLPAASPDALALLLALPMEEPNASKVATAGLDWVQGWLEEFERRKRNGRPINSPPAMLYSMFTAGESPPARAAPPGTDLAAYRLAAAKYPEVMTG